MSDKVMKKLNDQDEQLDSIARAVVDNKTDIEWLKENMATKSDIRKISDNIDILVKLAKKKDEELTFMGERVKRVEKDTQKIKPLVGLV